MFVTCNVNNFKIPPDGIKNGKDYVYHRESSAWGKAERTEIPWDVLNKNYEVETNTYHCFGKPDGIAWTTGYPSPLQGNGSVPSLPDGPKSPSTESIMIYGPYMNDVPLGANVASFKLKVDKRQYRLTNTSETRDYPIPANIAKIDVCQAGSSIMLASRLVPYSEINTTGSYKIVKIPYFNTSSTATTEFRVWTEGNTYNLSVDNITTSNCFHQTYEAETADFRHNIGSYIGGDGWQASNGTAGYMCFGPYTFGTAVGKNTAAFRIKITGTGFSTPGLLILEIVSNEVVIASRSINRNEFLGDDYYQFFTVNFNNDSQANKLQFRTWSAGQATVTEDKVIVYRSE
jgi:hypothetical protein